MIQQLQEILKEIDEACSECGRDFSEITLIGVTKMKPIEMIREAFEAGLTDFGENYVEDFFNVMGAPLDIAVYRESIGWNDWYDTEQSQKVLCYQNRNYEYYLSLIHI